MTNRDTFDERPVEDTSAEEYHATGDVEGEIAPGRVPSRPGMYQRTSSIIGA